MKTTECLQRFYKACRDKGLSPTTVRGYEAYLRHFEAEYDELPTDTPTIETFLRKRGEGPGRRGDVHKKLQAFYSWLAAAENIPSPVPSRGKVGRPPRGGQAPSAEAVDLGTISVNPPGKLVGGGIDPSKYTSISTYRAAAAFLQRRKVQGCTEKTITEYGHLLRRFIAMFSLVPLKPQDFDKFLNNPLWNGNTRFTYRRDLLAFYHWMEEFNYLPKGLVHIPEVDKGKTMRRILTAEELRSLFLLARTTQERSLLQTIIDTKCRIGELLSMTRENLQPDRCLVKGKVGERWVMLSPETYTMLCRLASSGPLFLDRGRVMTVGRAYRVLHDLMIRSGLSGKKLGPHILRHTAATQHIMAGGDMMTLQQELGHTTPVMTAQYARLATGQLASKHQQLDLLNKLKPVRHQDTAAAPGDDSRADLRRSEADLPPEMPEEEPPESDEPIRIGIKTRKLIQEVSHADESH